MSEDENFIILLNRMDTMLQKMEGIEKTLMQQTLLHKEVLNSKETALYMGRSVSGVYKLRRHNRLPGSRPNNGRLYFNRIDVYNWMMSEGKAKAEAKAKTKAKTEEEAEEGARLSILQQEGG